MFTIGEYPTLKDGWHYTKQEDFPEINEVYAARVWVWYGKNLYGVCCYNSSNSKPWEDFYEWDEEKNDCRKYDKYKVIAWHVLPICKNEKE